MLPKQRRLVTKVFDNVMLSGKVFHSPFFTLIAVKGAGGAPHKNRFAAVAAQKFFKTAVERNKVRRRLYAAMDDDFLRRVDANTHHASFDCIIMAKPALLTLSTPEITTALIDIFVQSAILK